MENNNNVKSSCLMLAASLNTPVSLGAIFEANDLKDTGIEYDSHITVLYARKDLSRQALLSDIDFLAVNDKGQSISDILKIEKKEEDFAIPVFEIFELGKFENDSDYVILKLKNTNQWYSILDKLNKYLGKKYEITSDYSTYTPHLSLAELYPGTADKYLGDERLKMILGNSLVHFEDLVISYDIGEDEYKKYNLTSFCAVDRFFRERELRNEGITEE